MLCSWFGSALFRILSIITNRITLSTFMQRIWLRKGPVWRFKAYDCIRGSLPMFSANFKVEAANFKGEALLYADIYIFIYPWMKTFNDFQHLLNLPFFHLLFMYIAINFLGQLIKTSIGALAWNVQVCFICKDPRQVSLKQLNICAS